MAKSRDKVFYWNKPLESKIFTKFFFSTKPLDLQLPKQEYEEYYEIPTFQEVEPKPREFKEKIVESLGEGKAAFKKRKFMLGAKRNTRQRVEDE